MRLVATIVIAMVGGFAVQFVMKVFSNHIPSSLQMWPPLAAAVFLLPIAWLLMRRFLPAPAPAPAAPQAHRKTFTLATNTSAVDARLDGIDTRDADDVNVANGLTLSGNLEITNFNTAKQTD